MEKKEKITSHNVKTAIRVALRYIKEYRNAITALSAVSIVSAIGHGVLPFIMGRFFDALSTDTGIETIDFSGHLMPVFIVLLVIWTLVQVITHALDWKITTESERLGNLIWSDYICKGFGRLLELPMSFHKRHKVGEVVEKINRAAGSIYELVCRATITLIPQFLSIAVALGIAFTIRPQLALLLVAGTFVYVAIAFFMASKIAAIDTEYYMLINKVYGNAHDAVGNALPIKQASAEKYEFDRLYKGFFGAVPVYLRAKKIWEHITLSQRLITVITQATVLVVASYSVQSGLLSIGDLITFFSYATMVFGPFAALALNWEHVQKGVINISKTEEVLSVPTENYEPEGSRPFNLRGDIVFKSASFHYDHGKPVLTDIGFEAKAGEVIALVGESGVGKSTLIDLIGAYHFPTSGTVEIDGMRTDILNLRSLREQMAVVPQEVVLFNDTIINNIRYGSFQASDEAVKEAARRAHAVDFIEKFPAKWEQEVGERGVKLSVGQKQRVAIARAVLRNPKILILDEPTSALDAGSEKIITESLEELMRGKTTFIIAHRLSTVRKADRILVFKEGRIVESGTHQELLRIEGGEYRRLHDLQIGLHS